MEPSPGTEPVSGGRALRFLPLGFMAVIVFITYGAIGWTLRRGFDWTDESFVYTMIASSRRAVGEPWGFHYLLHPLYILTGQSVLAFRVLRLAGYVMLSIALVGSARFVVRRIGVSIPRSGWVFILLLAQVGTFLAWSYPPRYLGYNELASWFSQLGVALILVSLAWGFAPAVHRRASWMLWSVWVGLGAVAALLVFSKVTSGVAFAALLALAIVIPNPNLRLWKRVVGAGAGVSAVLLVLWAGRYPMAFYLKNSFDLAFNKSAQRAFGHPVSGLIITAIRSMLKTGYALLPALLLFVLLAATFHRKARVKREKVKTGTVDWIAWVLGVLLVIALAAVARVAAQTGGRRILEWSYLGELVVFIGAAGIIGLVILGAEHVTIQRSAMSRSFSVALGAAAIMAAPFISAIGTNNPIAGQLLFAATLWAVVLGIALVLLTQRAELFKSSTRALPALLGCVVILMAALAVRGDITRPYLNAPYLSQDTSTSVPELRGLLLTETDAAWIGWVSAAGDSLGADHVPAISMDSPGALYAFNHSGYANPWLDPRAGDFISVHLACKTSRPADLFVLQPGTVTKRDRSAPKMTKDLAECGINFPGDFQIVDKRTSANPLRAMTIWRLKNG